jgi:hypothetical protein
MASMSLSRQLKDKSSPASRFFAARFPDVRSAQQDLVAQAADTETLLPHASDGYPWSVVGAAIDYRIRLAFPQAVAYASRWELVSETGGFGLPAGGDVFPLQAELGASQGAPYGFYNLWAGSFFASLRELLTEIGPTARRLQPALEEAMARHCFVLGIYDAIGRGVPIDRTPLVSVAGSADPDALSRLCPDAAVSDLVKMTNLFYDSQQPLLAATRVSLGPIFTGSADVHGADADLIVDGCLIDVKATKDVGSLGGKPWAWQLLGYTLLDYEDALKIRSVALYLARQGLLLQWSLDDFCEMLGSSKPSPLADLRRDFKRAVS